jgi:hypothetical protein
MYGLFVGPDDGYALPGKPFALSETEQGRGRIFFHFAPLSRGTILNARFTGGDAATVTLDLSLTAGKLSLRISSGDESRQETLSLNGGAPDTFITAILDFEITPEQFSASLALENPDRETKPLAIALAKPLSGEATVRFGGTETAAGTSGPSFDANGNPENGTIIFNELAISYTRTPIPQDTPEAEDNPALTEPAGLPEAAGLPTGLQKPVDLALPLR